MNNKISQLKKDKKHFDVNSIDDICEYDFYLKNKKWKNGCPFFLEWPYLNIEKMIETHIVTRFVNEKIRDKKFDFTSLDKHWTTKTE